MDKELRNYYEVLEIATDSTPEEIDRAYMRAKNAYSPESAALYSLMTAEECAQMQTLVEEAHDILSSPVKRRQYDEIRGLISRSTESPPREIGRERTITQSMGEANMEIPRTSMGLSKIVTRQQFTLEYQTDDSFESEIERTTEYTGPFLKRIREYKNVDIQRMADMTKISRSYLNKIEAEDMTGMPALVYVRGFILQYAKCLKLNPEMVATSYIHRMKKKREK